MRYCTFKYRISYADGSNYEGWSPYRGHDLDKLQLSRFVAQSYQELKPANAIAVFDVFEISDPRIWIAHIRHTVEFRYLYMAKGFATDVLQRYHPEDV